MKARFWGGCLLLGLYLLASIQLSGQAADFAASKDADGLGDDFLQRAQKQQLLGYYSEALKNYDLAVEQAKLHQMKDEMLEAIEGKGITLWSLGQMKEAADWFNQGASLSRKWRLTSHQKFFDTCLIIYELYQKGKERRVRFDYKGAIDCFQKAIDLAVESRYRELELKCLRQASLVYFDLNELDQFYWLNEKALRIARLLNHKLEEGRCLNNIALSHFKQGDLISAGLKFNEAISIALKLHDELDIADCLHNLGLIEFHVGFLDRALNYFKEALNIDKKLGKLNNIIIDLNHIALCLRKKGKATSQQTYIDESLNYLEEALRLAIEHDDLQGKIHSLNNAALALFDVNKKHDAINYLNEAIRLCKQLKNAYLLINIYDSLARICLDENPLLSLKLLTEALEYLPKIKDNEVGWNIYYNLGRCYEKLSRLEETIESYHRAIEVIEKTRRQIGYDFYQAGFLRSKSEVFDALVRARNKIYDQEPNKQNEEDLFLAIERTKARSFTEAIEKLNISPETANPFGEKEAQLRKDLARDTLIISASKRVDERKAKSVDKLSYILKEDSYLTLLASKHQQENAKQELFTGNIATIAEIQKDLLDGKTAIIEFYLGDWGSISVLLTKDELRCFFLPEKRLIEDSITGYIKILSNPPMEIIKGDLAAQRLYHELFEPIARFLPPSVENLIIVPDEYLYYLPFESLMFPGDKKDDRARYLITKYNISYAPSISSLLTLKRKNRNSLNRKDLLAVGAPNYNFFLKNNVQAKEEIQPQNLRDVFFQQDFRLSPLFYAKREIKKVASKFPRKSRTVFTGAKARESILKKLALDEFRIIHFACHGFVDESFPFRSALVLTPEPENEEDGFLQAYEISTFHLNADLVVLSACQSAKGPLEKTEGILGINRVFFTSGARSVLSSLWKINDESTAHLMSSFYDYLRKGWGISQALRAAKLDMIESKYNHPFYWAGFILSGDCFGSLF